MLVNVIPHDLRMWEVHIISSITTWVFSIEDSRHDPIGVVILRRTPVGPGVLSVVEVGEERDLEGRVGREAEGVADRKATKVIGVVVAGSSEVRFGGEGNREGEERGEENMCCSHSSNAGRHSYTRELI